MPRPDRTERRREKARRELLGKGVASLVLGFMLLTVLPMFMRGPFVALGSALRPLGWTLLAVGIGLVAIHFAIRRQTGALHVGRAQPPSTQKAWQEPSFAPDTLPPLGDLAAEVAHRLEMEWSPAVFAAIEWRRFEALCEAFYAQAGFTTRSQSHGADGGVDIWLQSQHMSALRIVQCKHWLNKPVGVKEMREFRGVMASHQLNSSTYVTSSTFTPDAVAFAKANGIQLQDGATLLKLIGQRTPAQQAALLAVAHEGEYWKPTCASCGMKTVGRERKRDGGKFWGCSNYPRCKTTFVMRPS